MSVTAADSQHTVDFVPLVTATAVEVDMAIICNCMPALHSLAKILFPKTMVSTHDRSYGPHSHTSSRMRRKPASHSTGLRSGIQVTQSTSVLTSKQNDSTVDIGCYYDLKDMGSISEVSGPEQRPQPVVVKSNAGVSAPHGYPAQYPAYYPAR